MNMKNIRLIPLLLTILASNTFVIADVNVSNGGGTPSVTYTEDQPAVIINSQMLVDYNDTMAEGYIEVNLTNQTIYDKLDLNKSTSASTTNQEITAVGSSLYKGNGTDSIVIGSINGIYDGNGKTLKIDFANKFTNGDFNTGSNGDTTVAGWTIVNSQVKFGVDTILGYATPTDTTWPTNASTEQLESRRGANNPITDTNTPSSAGTMTTALDTNINDSSGLSIKLRSTGITTKYGYDIVRGPYIYSNSSVTLSAGDTVAFDWQASGGADAYDVYGYILDINNGHIEKILDETGNSTSASTSWATKSITVSQAGTYKFVFVAGTYDYSGGMAAGAQLFVDNVAVTQAVTSDINATDVSQILRMITYKNTSVDANVTNKTVTFKVVSPTDINDSNTTDITIVKVNNDAPVFKNDLALLIDNNATSASSYNLNINVYDPDNNSTSFTWAISQSPFYGTASLSGVSTDNEVLTYVPSDDSYNNDRLIISVTDDNGSISYGIVNVTRMLESNVTFGDTNTTAQTVGSSKVITVPITYNSTSKDVNITTTFTDANTTKNAYYVETKKDNNLNSDGSTTNYNVKVYNTGYSESFIKTVDNGVEERPARIQILSLGGAVDFDNTNLSGHNNDSSMSAIANVDGSLTHNVTIGSITTQASISADQNTTVGGASYAITNAVVKIEDTEVTSEVQVNLGAWIIKAVAITDNTGATQTKFLKENSTTGEQVALDQTLDATTPYGQGATVEIKNLNNVLYIKTRATLDGNLKNQIKGMKNEF